MAQLPQASDYGARVGLRSNRVDLPGQGELAVADALANAAAAFTGMAIEHKQKDDALSYSNAKNEYLIADIQERDKLQDDQDFATHDERYRTAMKGHYERLFPTVKSNRDRVLFDSEARLMNERGAVAVGDNSRTKEIDWNLGQFSKNMTAAKGIILAASDAQTAQDAMFGVLEQGAAIRERGYLTEEQYQAAMQKFVTETAFARLVAMDPAEREILLERSITMAKTKGEPITRPQIAAGEGSGSIADFLTLDVRVKMLEETRKSNNHKAAMDEAYSVMDGITTRHTDPAKVLAAIQEAGKGMDSDARTALNSLGVAYRQNAVAVEAIERDNIMTAAGEMINNDQDPATMDPDLWEKLLPNQQEALTKQYLRGLQGEGFGETDTMYSKPNLDSDRHVITDDGSVLLGEASPQPSYSYWKSIPREQRPGVKLDDAQWRMAFTQPMWQRLKDEQDMIQKEIDSGKAPKLPGGMTNQQLVQAALVRTGKIPQTGRSDKEQEIYYSALASMDYMTQQRQTELGRALTNEERRKVMVEMMVDTAFTDRDFLWFDDDYDPEEKKPVALMSAKERRVGFLPIADARVVGGYVDPKTGIAMTVEDYITAAARRGDFGEVYNGTISDDDMERAFFALDRLSKVMSPAEVDAEILSRLKGE